MKIDAMKIYRIAERSCKLNTKTRIVYSVWGIHYSFSSFEQELLLQKNFKEF